MEVPSFVSMNLKLNATFFVALEGSHTQEEDDITIPELQTVHSI